MTPKEWFAHLGLSVTASELCFLVIAYDEQAHKDGVGAAYQVAPEPRITRRVVCWASCTRTVYN